MPDKMEENSSAFRTARGALYITLKNLVTGIAGSVFFMLIARLLPSVSDLGLIHGLQILIVIGSTLAGLGLTNASSRFISYHIGAGRINKAKEVSNLIFRMGLVSSFFIAIAFFAIAEQVAIIFFHDISNTGLVQLSAIDIFVFSMVNFSSYLLYSLQEFKRVAIFMTANAVIKFSAAFVLMSELGIEGVISGMIFGDIVTLIPFIWILKSRIGITGIRWYSQHHIHTIRSLLDYSLPIFGGQVLYFFSVNIDYYLVLILSGLYIAGIYSPAVLIGSMFLTVVVGAGETLLPHFSRIYGKSGINSLKEVSISTSRYIFLIYYPLGFALLALAVPLIILIFGERYSEAIYPAVTIILATTLTSIGIVFNYILMSAGYTRLFLVTTSIALAAQIILSVVTIPSIGANGAALARAMAFIIGLLYPAYRLRQIAGLYYDIPALRSGLIGSIIMASVIFLLNNYLSAPYYLPLNFLSGFFSYLVYLRLTGTMKNQDFDVLDKVFSHKLRLLIILIKKIVVRGY